MATVLCDWHADTLERLMATIVGDVEKARVDITEHYSRTCGDCDEVS